MICLNIFKYIGVAGSVLGLSCVDQSSLSPFGIECDNHVVVYDSFQVELLEVDPSTAKIKLLKTIEPKNEVIGQAIFDCRNGAILFNTEERMKSGIDNVLHVVYKDGDNKKDFKYGISLILPHGDNEYIIREQLIRKNKEKISSENSSHADNVRHFISQDSLMQKDIFVNDLLFDIRQMQIRKTVPGTFDETLYQNGKYITYTSNKIALNYDPDSGGRDILINYKVENKDGKFHPEITQRGAQHFYFGNKLFLVNGESTEGNSQRYLEKNSIFKFDDIEKKWNRKAILSDVPISVIQNKEKIIILGRNSLNVFNQTDEKLEKFNIPVESNSWKSIAALKDSYVVSGVNSSNEMQLFLTSKDFSIFTLLHKVENFSNPKLSTILTPIAPKQILQ